MERVEFDAVVVGSGFGGSVMTYRLAQAGLKVCLLERGKSYAPGDFPRGPYGMKRNFWDPSAGLYGLFNVWMFGRLAAIVASGLGGGSLIYANVLIRKDPAAFDEIDPKTRQRRWPIRYDDLERHYTRVEQILGGEPFPFERSPYSGTRKTEAFRLAAEQAGLEATRPRLGITFARDGEEPGAPIREERRNYHDSTRYTCRLCGECDIGCNYGSKNTLDYTYLSRAHRDSDVTTVADIRPLCEVRSFEPLGGRGENGYAVHYVRHPPAAGEGVREDAAKRRSETVTARHLILSAGTLGTTFLLLKNRSAFPHISDRLGQRFCGNGDLLTFAVRCTEPGSDRRPLIIDTARGPVITSTIHVKDLGAARDEFYIQDGGYPEVLGWLLPNLLDVPAFATAAFRIGGRLLGGMLRNDPHTDVGAKTSDLFRLVDGSSSALLLLGMGRDAPTGVLKLNHGMLDLDWQIRDSERYYKLITTKMRDMTEGIGGHFRDPLGWLYRRVTVHPLGGCPMGEGPSTGVVDAHGQVFGYRNLYVADGSVMPGPTGANPSLTIAALADRFADRVIANNK